MGKGLGKVIQKVKLTCCNYVSSPNPTPTPEPTDPNEPVAPVDNCQVHFSGVLMIDEFEENWFSVIYQVDQYSELVGAGDYSDNKTAFPQSVETTFDGIAIDHGVRLQIYTQPNFSGSIAIDVIGPKIINNRMFISKLSSANYGTKTFTPSVIQDKFPPDTRYINSKAVDLRNLSFGSCKITCGHDPANSLDLGIEKFS